MNLWGKYAPGWWQLQVCQFLFFMPLPFFFLFSFSRSENAQTARMGREANWKLLESPNDDSDRDAYYYYLNVCAPILNPASFSTATDKNLSIAGVVQVMANKSKSDQLWVAGVHKDTDLIVSIHGEGEIKRRGGLPEAFMLIAVHFFFRGVAAADEDLRLVYDEIVQEGFSRQTIISFSCSSDGLVSWPLTA